MLIGVGALGFMAAGCIANDQWPGAAFFGIVAGLWFAVEVGRSRT